MKIVLTKEHLEKGTRYSTRKCPVGLACKAAKLNVVVGATYLFDEITNEIANLPDNVADVIEKFDRRKPINHVTFPLTFEVTFKKV